MNRFYYDQRRRKVRINSGHVIGDLIDTALNLALTLGLCDMFFGLFQSDKKKR